MARDQSSWAQVFKRNVEDSKASLPGWFWLELLAEQGSGLGVRSGASYWPMSMKHLQDLLQTWMVPQVLLVSQLVPPSVQKATLPDHQLPSEPDDQKDLQ